MASVTRRLVFSSARCSRRITQQQWQRSLSSTAPLADDKPKPRFDKNANPPKPELVSKDPVLTTAEPVPHNKGVSMSMAREEEAKKQKARKEKPPKPSPEETEAAQVKSLMANIEALDPANILEAQRKGQRGQPWKNHYRLERDEDFVIEPTTGKPGFWAEGQEELGPDEDYYGDDITSHGHGQLEERRDMRHYARMIAWELPLLGQLAKPFELPTAATPFRFRYTSYLGESHPAANKVVVEFSPSDLKNLTSQQKDKLIKLCGPRYNPSTDLVKMSCELFDTLPQNKRFLGDTISKLLAEARDPKDTFADVPFDFRHHKPKVRHVFPKEWELTEERKKYLEEKRAQQLKLDDERTQNGTLVDGIKVIENALPFMTPEPEPVMVGTRGRKMPQLR
ncbi:uncharacterized protein EI97DRAFT_432993 [Westerdykella ornata]|uniref:Small ribosomal subunit protein mS35 mitochondrial conserved domain-containing protein n=1 Tax=Westerdykella ornata TaxID=318751 RepID=A0A6A6JKJ7_WESOR|nr:uncharacterized protein EI97DRAFT_432993 [Westerdykella ornata]KAF2276755.1 hypothetical protein EI97DRAFT_432993 [Westerdykella ornata]